MKARKGREVGLMKTVSTRIALKKGERFFIRFDQKPQPIIIHFFLSSFVQEYANKTDDIGSYFKSRHACVFFREVFVFTICSGLFTLKINTYLVQMLFTNNRTCVVQEKRFITFDSTALSPTDYLQVEFTYSWFLSSTM